MLLALLFVAAQLGHRGFMVAPQLGQLALGTGPGVGFAGQPGAQFGPRGARRGSPFLGIGDPLFERGFEVLQRRQAPLDKIDGSGPAGRRRRGCSGARSR